jgi:hypothetical protein
MANKPTSMSYFIKRLYDSGYAVEKLFTNYSSMDARVWTVIIDPGNSSIFCTCFQNKNGLGDNYLELSDGGQRIPSYKIKTSSIEVILSHLNKYGITQKRKEYGGVVTNEK